MAWRARPAAPFGMFEITAAGLIMAAAGMIYLLTVGRHLLPERDTLSAARPAPDRNFMTELRVPLNSPVIGKTIAEANLNGGSGLQVLQVNRDSQLFSRPEHDFVLSAGDLLMIHGQVKDVVELRESGHLTFNRGDAFETISSEDVILAEAIVGRGSRYSHRPMRDLDLSARYGISVLAVHRRTRTFKATSMISSCSSATSCWSKAPRADQAFRRQRRADQPQRRTGTRVPP